LFGAQNERDVKEVMPWSLPQTNTLKIYNLSHDELRNKTVEFAKRIADAIATETEEIQSSKNKPKLMSHIDEQEKNVQRIDRLEKKQSRN